MIYTIINPSDRATMRADDDAVASLACMLISTSYGLDEGERKVCPIFRFGGDPEEWFATTHGVAIDAFLQDRRTAIADALDSVMLGDRLLMESVLRNEGLEAMLRHEDRIRTSMTDICGRARRVAKWVRHEMPGAPTSATNQETGT